MEQNVYLNAIATTTMLRRCREDVFKSKVRGGFRFVRNDFLCGCIVVVVVVRKMLMNTFNKMFPILDARLTRGSMRIVQIHPYSTPSSFVIITAISRSKVTRVIESHSAASRGKCAENLGNFRIKSHDEGCEKTQKILKLCKSFRKSEKVQNHYCILKTVIIIPQRAKESRGASRIEHFSKLIISTHMREYNISNVTKEEIVTS